MPIPQEEKRRRVEELVEIADNLSLRMFIVDISSLELNEDVKERLCSEQPCITVKTFKLRDNTIIAEHCDDIRLKCGTIVYATNYNYDAFCDHTASNLTDEELITLEEAKEAREIEERLSKITISTENMTSTEARNAWREQFLKPSEISNDIAPYSGG